MVNFEKYKRICDENSAASREYVDDFMMYYAAGRDNVEKEMEVQFRRFRHITHQFPQSVVNQMKAQYIIHRVLRRDGLIGKYINHATVLRKGPDALKFFKAQLDNPWRFAFTEMIDMVAPHFHHHRDVFTGEEYLIYSPGMSQTFSDHDESVCMWFNLLAFNGHCWQTYGPIAAYKSIEPDDVFYFGTELDDRISGDDDLLDLISRNPVPFMMLVSGGNVPVVVNNNDPLVVHTAAVDTLELDPERLRPSFSIVRSRGIVKLSLPPWDEPMHYSAAYLDTSDGELFCYAMTARGFKALTDVLAEKGIKVDGPDILVNISSIVTMESILSRKIKTNPYESLFDEPSSEKDDAMMQKLNVALNLAMTDFNARRGLDYEAYAAATGLTIDELKPIIEASLERVRNLLNRN